MEPIKINVEVSLSEATLETLRTIAVSISSAIMTNNLREVVDSEEQVRSLGAEVIEGQRDVQRALSDQKKEEAKEKPAEAPTAEQPATEEDPGDMPDFEAISDDDMILATRKAVAGMKAAGKSPVIIRTEIFAKYGISESKACPPEKRAELYNELAKLW